jgi:RecB family exonuclease
VPELPPREPAVFWTLSEGAVGVRRALSATSIETMLECPLRWTFQNSAGLTPGAASRRSDERAAIGAFAHLLLQELVLYPADVAFDALTPEEAARRVEVAFDARVGAEAATLLLPGNAATLARTRRQIVDATPALVRTLRAGGWWPVLQAEASFSGRFAGHETTGRADLVVARADGARAVIDIKLGGSRPDGKLRDGTALQLAIYAQGFGTEGGLARGAYFIVEDGRLLSSDPDAFPAPSWHVPGPPLGEAFLDAERAWTWWEGAVRSGVVAASGVAEKGTVVGGAAEILSKEPFGGPWRDARPFCAWCDQRRICQFTVRAELPDVVSPTTEGGEA